MNIEAMAREAGMRPYQEQAPGIDGAVGDWSALERFAALVRAQALEDAARVCEENVEAAFNACLCACAEDMISGDEMGRRNASAIRALTPRFDCL